MAAEGSTSVAFDKQELDDTVSCCICTDIYTDPKALPCIHTFCMKCLQQVGLSTNKGPGDEMPCPICRRKFKIPSEGFSGLPNNFFIAKLIQAANIPNPTESDICDVCLEDNKEATVETSKANKYCTDCTQKLCEECCKQHRKFKPTKKHNIISIDEHRLSRDNMMGNLPPSVCVIHEEKALDIYCYECKTVQCAVCFIDGHKHHDGSHVNKYVEDFRKQIESNIEAINGCSSKTLMKKAELIKIKEDMQQKLERLEEHIVNRKGELKQLVDSQANSLLQSLSLLNQSKLKNIQMETDDVDAHLSCLQSYSSYCQKMTTKGSASDICRTVSELSAKAAELQKQCQFLNEREIQFFMASFMKSEFEEFLEGENLIGEIKDDCNSRQACTSKIAVLRKQSIDMDLLKANIKLERREKENFRLEAEQLKMSLKNEQTTNSTLKVDNDKLRQELKTQKRELTDLLKEKEQTKEDLEKTLQADIDKLRQKLETQKRELTDLLKDKERENEDLEKTKTELRATILDVEQKRKKERKVSKKDKEELLSQIHEHHQLMDRLRSDYKTDVTIVQLIKTKAAEEENKSIGGMTILDKELFVLHAESSEVEVYDSITFLFSRRWKLTELIQPQDIVSCDGNKCLYIFDYKGYLSWSNEILRVDKDGKLIKKWSVGSNFGYSLSVTSESNVILPVYKSRTLNEYSPDGQLIRKVTILSDPQISEIWHAIKMTNGHFLISLRSMELFPGVVGPRHGVCIVNGDGKLEVSNGGAFFSSIGYMNVPFHLCVDGNRFVMVVDRDKGRVLLFDSYLDFKREILSKEEHGLRRPMRIVLDEPNGRLFVADNDSNNQRIFIFDVK